MKIFLRAENTYYYDIHPRLLEKLLLMNGVDAPPQILHDRFLTYRIFHVPTDPDGEDFVRGQCIMGGPRRRPTPDYSMPQPLTSDLLRPFLISRMQQASEHHCLLSVFIDRSINLIEENTEEFQQQDRQRIRREMAASFDTRLLKPRFSRYLFDSLFDSIGIGYWLPLYDAAHLTVYPKPEDNLRLYYIFRLCHIAKQKRDPRDDEIRYGPIGDLLASPPTTPEYARLFAIDCFNLAVKSNNDLIYHELCFSNTGKLLSNLTVPERIWCAAKQTNQELCAALIDRALGEPIWVTVGASRHRLSILVIVEALVQAGDTTHSGRVAIEELLECKDVKQIRSWVQDFDPENVTQIQEKMQSEFLWRGGN